MAAKVSNKVRSQNKSKSVPDSPISLLLKKHGDWLAIVVLSLVIVIFFQKVFIGDGSFWGSSDNISAQSFKNYLEQSEEFPLWQPYIFGGLPGYGAMMSAAVRTWDYTYLVIH